MDKPKENVEAEGEDMGNELLNEMFEGAEDGTNDLSANQPEDETTDEDTPDTSPPQETSEESSQGDEEVLGEAPSTDDVFQKEGLAERFENPGEVLTKFREQEAYITQIQQERAQLMRDQLQQQTVLPQQQQQTSGQTQTQGTPFQVNPDQLLEDPAAVVTAMTQHVTEQAKQQVAIQVAQHVDNMEVDTFFKTTTDVNDHLPAMGVLFQQNPEVANTPKAKALGWLYKMAKLESAAVQPVQKVKPSPGSNNKDRASSDGGTSRKPKGNTKPNWGNMSETAIEKIIGVTEN